MFFEALDKRAVAFVGRFRLVHDDNIKAFECVLVMSKRFPDKSLEPVPSYCPFEMLLRNSQAKPGCPDRVLAAQHRKPFIPATRRFFEYTAERRSIQQPAVFAKPVPSVAFQIGDYTCRRDGLDGTYRQRKPVTALALRGLLAGYGVSFARPFARRRLRTRRPALVAIRARKPCVRARFNLLG